MSDFYSRLAETSYKLISKKGTDCIITSAEISGGFDPETGLPTDDLPATIQQGKCVVLNYRDSLYNAPESLIQIGDKKLLLSAKGVTIDSLNGTVSALGDTYRVMSVKDLNPAGVTLIFEIHGRK